MSGERTYLVTLEARVRAEVAVEATSKGEATRRALEEGPEAGELVSTPQRLTARVCRVREAGSCPAA